MSLLDWLFPPKCPFCGKVLPHQGICPDCRRELPWAEVVVKEGPGYGRCAAPLRYEGLAREAILRFKFSGKVGAAAVFGELVASAAAEAFPGEFDAVTYVPVSRRRLKERGFDQARMIAEAAGRLWDTKPLALLRKTEDNPAQSGLEGAAQRRANVIGVYEASREAADRRILLIDDVVTTGSTLSECVRVLRMAGAKSVVCAAVAQTSLEHDSQKDT